MKSLTEVSFDSYMLSLTDLVEQHRYLRLLEVDQRLHLPIRTSVRVLVTASDVIHS
jgi:cytochrome c oxidase subunit 2